MPNPTGHTDSIKNSQFKAAWQSGPTRTIRVPIALADATLEYARQLDQGIEPRDTRNNVSAEVDTNIALSPDTSDSNREIFDHALTTPEQALADAAIFGFTQEEALADCHFQINMLQANYDELEDRYEVAKRDQEEVEAELADLAQLKKEVKAAAAELHREENCMKLEKVRWQRELSDAKDELADAKATMLKQAHKIRELERGYSFKPNPAERRLRLEIGELQTQLSDLKQSSATASQELPEAADLLNQLKAKRKKSNVTLADVEAILEMIEKSGDDTSQR